MDGVWNFGCHGLVQRKRSRMALNGMMLLFPLAFQLLPLYLFAFSVYHLLLLPLSFDQLTLPRVPFTLSVDGLGGTMLHRLSDTGKRVSSTMRRSGGMVRRRLVWGLAQFRQPREGVAGLLASWVIGTSGRW